MTNIHRFPDMEQAEREAGDWIARLNADDATDEDRAQFESWRAAHQRHARVYDELSSTWREFKDAGHIVRAVSFGTAMNAVSNIPSAPLAGLRARWGVFAAAACLAAGVAVAFWFLHPVPETQFQTAIGEQASVRLPDGSTLELNSNSLARVDYTQQSRVIRLKRGEGFFKVAHDEQRPFWVVAGNSWVRAVGTAFNVRYVDFPGRPAEIRVIVSEGVVKVAAERPGTGTPSDAELSQAAVSILKAGQQAELLGRAAEIHSLASAELLRSVAWRQGTISFDAQPLSVAVVELSRYTPMQIVIEDEALERLPIGGTFQANNQGAQALLKMLEEGLGLHVRRDGDRRAYVSE